MSDKQLYCCQAAVSSILTTYTQQASHYPACAPSSFHSFLIRQRSCLQSHHITFFSTSICYLFIFLLNMILLNSKMHYWPDSFITKPTFEISRVNDYCLTSSLTWHVSQRNQRLWNWFPPSGSHAYTVFVYVCVRLCILPLPSTNLWFWVSLSLDHLQSMEPCLLPFHFIWCPTVQSQKLILFLLLRFFVFLFCSLLSILKAFSLTFTYIFSFHISLSIFYNVTTQAWNRHLLPHVIPNYLLVGVLILSMINPFHYFNWQLLSLNCISC